MTLHPCSSCGRLRDGRCSDCETSPQPSTGCVLGCTIRHRHLSTCPVEDHEEATADGEHWCHGCRPRPRRHGLLCETCHNRMKTWLTGPYGLAWTLDWLTENLSSGGQSAARQDWQRPGADDGPALPLRVAVYDLRTRLSDRVWEIDGCVREEFDRPAPDQPFDLRDSCSFLNAWLTKTEDVEHLIVHAYELFSEVMRDAAALVPWRDRPRKIRGVACPHCEREALAVFSGDEDVTCRNCWSIIPKERYEIWTKMCAAEATTTKEAS